MPTDVAVSGVGIHPFGRHDGKALLELARPALCEALDGANCRIAEVDAVFVGNALGRSGAIAALAEDLGIDRIPVTRIEQACASGSTALRLACEAVSGGQYETVVALGVEKMGRGLLQLDDEITYEARLGLDLFPLLYGLKSRQYMETAGVTAEDLASICVKARRLGTWAAHAATDREVSLGEALAAPQIAEPVTRLQCCRNADGAAAVVVTAARANDGLPRIRGWIGGISVEDPNLPMEGGWDSRERIVQSLSRRLYEKAGVGPDDINLVQVNDAFAVAEPLYLEALGFAEPGQGIRLHRDGTTDLGGRLPTNTDGGLMGRGHCLGATGLAMVYEVVTQLSGRAGKRQVDSCRTGLVQSHGYGGENLFVITN